VWVRQLLRKVWRIDPGFLGLEAVVGDRTRHARPESLVTTDKRALVLINDASCLIDLRKGALLDVLVHLPYQLVIPLPVRLSEVLDFSAQDWAILDHRGMVTYGLPSDRRMTIPRCAASWLS
jgi:hypothetical protein